MKTLVKVVRISSKTAFKRLRDEGPILCTSLEDTLKVSNLFFRHISGSSKKRALLDVVKRLSLINLIETISQKGNLVEVRKDPLIEKKWYPVSYKIRFTISNINFFIIIAKLKSGKLILISTFYN